MAEMDIFLQSNRNELHHYLYGTENNKLQQYQPILPRRSRKLRPGSLGSCNIFNRLPHAQLAFPIFPL